MEDNVLRHAEQRIWETILAVAPTCEAIELRNPWNKLAGVITVSEDEIVDGMRVAAREAKLVLEPSGATALAALLSHRGELPNGTVVVVASGGNVDPELFQRLAE